MLRLLSRRELARFRPRVPPPPAAAARTSGRTDRAAAIHTQRRHAAGSTEVAASAAASTPTTTMVAPVCTLVAGASPRPAGPVQLWPLPQQLHQAKLPPPPATLADMLQVFLRTISTTKDESDGEGMARTSTAVQPGQYHRGGLLVIQPEGGSAPGQSLSADLLLLARRLNLQVFRAPKMAHPGGACLLHQPDVLLGDLPVGLQPRFLLVVDLTFAGGRLSAMTLKREGRVEKTVSGGVVCVNMEDASEYKRKGAHGYDTASPLVQACMGDAADRQAASPPPATASLPPLSAVPSPVHILDATMGAGIDSFLLSSFGARVTMVEQDPILALLMMDGLRRASGIDATQAPESAVAAHHIATRMTLVHGDHTAYLRSLPALPPSTLPHVIYADPFYPDPPKSQLSVQQDTAVSRVVEGPSGRSKKSMELARTLWKDRCGADMDAAAATAEQQRHLPEGTSFHPSPANQAIYDLLHTSLHLPSRPSVILKQPSTPYARRLVVKQMLFAFAQSWKSRDTVFHRVEAKGKADNSQRVEEEVTATAAAATAAVGTTKSKAAVSPKSNFNGMMKKKKTSGRRGLHTSTATWRSNEAAAPAETEATAVASFSPSLSSSTSSSSSSSSSPLSYSVAPIGHLRTVFPDKFSMPRQGCLAPSATAVLTLDPTSEAARRVELPNKSWAKCVEGLEAFSHVWIVFLFHEHVKPVIGAAEDRPSVDSSAGARPPPPQHHHIWNPTVRPPRLGGSTRVGVFASRSPYRPNSIGMSLVKLDSVQVDQPSGKVWLRFSGVDLIDGTPVLDIKPYIPYCDSVAEDAAETTTVHAKDATSDKDGAPSDSDVHPVALDTPVTEKVRVGWAQEKVKRYPVEFAFGDVAQQVELVQRHLNARCACDRSHPVVSFRSLLVDLLSLDPRHGYQQQQHPAGSRQAVGKEYGFQLLEWNVTFAMTESGFQVRRVETMQHWRSKRMAAKRRREADSPTE